MSPRGDLIFKLLTNESLTQKFDKQVQSSKQVNQISVTNNSIILKQLR